MKAPPDCCRYKRPFEDQFADCPLYEGETFIATNLREVPLAAIRTCGHLTVGQYPDERGHLYAKCLIGDPASRRQAVLAKLRVHPAA